MGNDLISRSALMQSLRGNVLVDVTPDLEDAIEEQPVADSGISIQDAELAADIDRAIEYFGDELSQMSYKSWMVNARINGKQAGQALRSVLSKLDGSRTGGTYGENKDMPDMRQGVCDGEAEVLQRELLQGGAHREPKEG